jgi:hypothetical protein
LTHTSELAPEHIVRRVSANEVRTLAALYPWVKPRELLTGAAAPAAFQIYWEVARSDTFELPTNRLAVQSMKTR